MGTGTASQVQGWHSRHRDSIPGTGTVSQAWGQGQHSRHRDGIPGRGTGTASQAQGQHPRHGDSSHCASSPGPPAKRPLKSPTSSGGDQQPPCLGTSGCGQQSPGKPHTSRLSPLSMAGLQLPKSRMHIVEAQATQTPGPHEDPASVPAVTMSCATQHSQSKESPGAVTILFPGKEMSCWF